MEKEILFGLKGLQMDGGEEAELETVLPAEYYQRNGNHYVVYEEMLEGIPEPVKNIFKFQDECLEVTKRGAVNVHMVFEKGKKNMTSYQTPFGNILIGIDTEKIKITEEKDRIQVHVDYVLEANYQYLADCRIDMDLCAKKEGAKLFI